MTYQIKDIEGYEGLYQVDNQGNVWSLKFGKRRKLRAGVSSGYLIVVLCKNGKPKTHKVHRLVAQAFISNPQNLPCINHKDECKTNNLVENLEWCTQRYNMLYSGNHLKANKASVKSCSKGVLQYTLDGEFVNEYPSTREASRQTGINQSDIVQCCRGHKNYSHAGGYVWEYK